MKQGFTAPVLMLLAGLAGCGGGGTSGGQNTNPVPDPGTGTTPPPAVSWVAGQYPAHATLKNYCANPRSGRDPFSGNLYPDKAGSALYEKMWLRSWSNHMYLWYRELPDLDPAPYSVADYFNLLRTTQRTDSGAFKDNYHFAEDTATYLKRTQGAVQSGYGFEWVLAANRPPRSMRVAYTEANSPAAQAMIGRGARLLEVDGIDFINDNTQAGVDKINAALSPAKAGESHQFTFSDVNGNRRSYTLVSADVPTMPVQNVKVLQQGNRKVGYLQFNSHIAAAQPQLISAVEQFRSAAVNELVLDMRYNGGGLLALASQLGYMLSGPNQIQSRPFETMKFNDKHPTTDPQTGRPLQPTPFYTRQIDYNAGVLTNQNLPNLNLSRIFVLTTDGTCSASEALINGLRGIDVEVILIGGQTCGKPYGFYPTDNCGTTYFTIQFSGVNAKGFGEFSDGFVPTPAPRFAADVKGCPVGDDFSRALGDSEEGMLKTALYYSQQNSCPVLALSALTESAATEQASRSDGLAIAPPAGSSPDQMIRQPIGL